MIAALPLPGACDGEHPAWMRPAKTASAFGTCGDIFPVAIESLAAAIRKVLEKTGVELR